MENNFDSTDQSAASFSQPPAPDSHGDYTAAAKAPSSGPQTRRTAARPGTIAAGLAFFVFGVFLGLPILGVQLNIQATLSGGLAVAGAALLVAAFWPRRKEAAQ